MRKPVFGISDQVRHKPGCEATENDYRLEISDKKRDCTIRIAKTKALISYCAADPRLSFRICKKPVFSQRGSNILSQIKTPLCMNTIQVYLLHRSHGHELLQLER